MFKSQATSKKEKLHAETKLAQMPNEQHNVFHIHPAANRKHKQELKSKCYSSSVYNTKTSYAQTPSNSKLTDVDIHTIC